MRGARHDRLHVDHSTPSPRAAPARPAQGLAAGAIPCRARCRSGTYRERYRVHHHRRSCARGENAGARDNARRNADRCRAGDFASAGSADSAGALRDGDISKSGVGADRRTRRLQAGPCRPVRAGRRFFAVGQSGAPCAACAGLGSRDAVAPVDHCRAPAGDDAAQGVGRAMPVGPSAVAIADLSGGLPRLVCAGR